VIIQAQDILSPFSNLSELPGNFVISDANYYCPTRATVDNLIVPAYRWWMKSLKWTTWTHKFDCDNFADAFKLFACGWHAHNSKDNAEGIAVGVINYMADSRAEDGSKGGHAINVIYCEAGKNDDGTENYELLFMEPQNGGGTYYNLTDAEFKSIWTVYL